jgi:hypothetical protein
MRRRDIIVGLGSAAAIPLWAHVNLRLPSWTGFGKTGRSLGRYRRNAEVAYSLHQQPKRSRWRGPGIIGLHWS